jgi:hypothetical protein
MSDKISAQLSNITARLSHRDHLPLGTLGYIMQIEYGYITGDDE